MGGSASLLFVIIFYIIPFYQLRTAMTSTYSQKLYDTVGVTEGFSKDRVRSKDDSSNALHRFYSQRIYAGNVSAQTMLSDMKIRLEHVGFTEISEEQGHLPNARCRGGGVYIVLLSDSSSPETTFRFDVYEGGDISSPICPQL